MPLLPRRSAFQARVSAMTLEIARAVECAGALVRGPIRLAGHSAGGHLVARMGCRDIALDPDIRDRLAHILPLSPVTDLRPLLEVAMNETLRLDAAEWRTRGLGHLGRDSITS